MNWLKKLFGKSEPNEPTETLKVRGGTITLSPIKPGSAQAEWQRRRKTTTGTLVILVNPDDHSEMREDAEDGDPADIITQSTTINLPKFFAARLESLGLDEDEEEEEDEEYANARQEPDPAKLVKAKIPINAFTDIEPGKATYLSEVPCREPWQVFAHYPFGGWNDVPYDHELTAVCKDWFERFGAVPALISGDVVEFYLDRPVTDPAVAAKLAMEMYILCPDAVDQGTESTEELANSILGANVWYFWWD